MAEEGEERARASTEAYIVLLLEMVVFLGCCLGGQAAVRNTDEQPALVTTVLVVLFLGTGVLAIVAAINELQSDMQGTMFVLARAAWHLGLATSVNAKAFVALTLSAGNAAHQRRWSQVLLQTSWHTLENRFFTAAQNAWVLAVISVVVLMQTVFYAKVSRGAGEERNCVVGRFSTALACSALLVQYTVEMELERACELSPPDLVTAAGRALELDSCELTVRAGPLAKEYTLLRPVFAALAALLASDVLLCVLYRRLGRLRHSRSYAHGYVLQLLYALVALLPCAAYFVVVFVVLQYTSPAHFVYLISVGAVLGASCARRVWDSLGRHAAARRAALEAAMGGSADDGEREEPDSTPSAQASVNSKASMHTQVSLRVGAILRGTAQGGARGGDTKKGR